VPHEVTRSQGHGGLGAALGHKDNKCMTLAFDMCIYVRSRCVADSLYTNLWRTTLAYRFSHYSRVSRNWSSDCFCFRSPTTPLPRSCIQHVELNRRVPFRSVTCVIESATTKCNTNCRSSQVLTNLELATAAASSACSLLNVFLHRVSLAQFSSMKQHIADNSRQM